MSRRSQSRHQQFQTQSDAVYLAQQAKAKRTACAVKISKTKRAEIIETHRLNSGQLPTTDHDQMEMEAELSEPESFTESAADPTADLAHLSTIIDDLSSPSSHLQLDAATRMGAIFLTDFENIPKPLLGKVIPKFIGFLKHHDVRVQLQALKGLSNLISNPKARTQAEAIVECGLIPALVAIFRVKTCLQFVDATILLGTIADQSKEWTKQIVRFLPEFHIDGTQNPTESSRAVAWMISKLARHKPAWRLLFPSFPLLSQLIHFTDEDTVIHTCWTLYLISALYQKADRNGIQSIIEHGVTRRAVELTVHYSTQVQLAALHVILNISTGNDLHVRVLIICRVGLYLAQCLRSPHPTVVRIACSIMSNIMAHECVFEHGDMPAFMCLLSSPDSETREEVSRGLSNLMLTGTTAHIADCARSVMVERALRTTTDKYSLLVLATSIKDNLFSSQSLPTQVFKSILDMAVKADQVRATLVKLKTL